MSFRDYSRPDDESWAVARRIGVALDAIMSGYAKQLCVPDPYIALVPDHGGIYTGIDVEGRLLGGRFRLYGPIWVEAVGGAPDYIYDADALVDHCQSFIDAVAFPYAVFDCDRVEEFSSWCAENCCGLFSIKEVLEGQELYGLSFEDEDDAILFKLRWL